VTFFDFNLSNPLLHISKLVNYLEMGAARKVAFLVFTVVFFVTRIVLLPGVVIRRFVL